MLTPPRPGWTSHTFGWCMGWQRDAPAHVTTVSFVLTYSIHLEIGDWSEERTRRDHDHEGVFLDYAEQLSQCRCHYERGCWHQCHKYLSPWGWKEGLKSTRHYKSACGIASWRFHRLNRNHAMVALLLDSASIAWINETREVGARSQEVVLPGQACMDHLEKIADLVWGICGQGTLRWFLSLWALCHHLQHLIYRFQRSLINASNTTRKAHQFATGDRGGVRRLICKADKQSPAALKSYVAMICRTGWGQSFTKKIVWQFKKLLCYQVKWSSISCTLSQLTYDEPLEHIA